MKIEARFVVLGYIILLIFLYAFASTHPSMESLSKDRIATIGGNTNYIISSDGTLVGWGDNSRGQMGGGILPGYSHFLRRAILNNAISVDTAANHAIAVDEYGDLWGWGSTTLMPNQDSQSRPVRLMIDVAAASTANAHTIVLRNDSSVWVFGENTYGQLGQGYADEEFNTLHKPQKVMDNAIAVFADSDTSFAITTDNDLYMWGDVESPNESSFPQKVAENIQDIDRGHGYQVLTLDGTVYHLDPSYSDVVIEDVREIFFGGLIKNDGSSWIWVLTDNTPTLVPLHHSVAHAASSCLYVTSEGFIVVDYIDAIIPSIPYSVSTLNPLIQNIALLPFALLFVFHYGRKYYITRKTTV